MGILAKLLRPNAGPPPWDDYWFNPVGSLTTAGIRVTADTAFNVSAIYASIRIISETVAQIPLIVYRRMPNGGKERATNHPLFDLLHSQPNPWQSSFEWREMMTGHLALRGNAYNEIIPGPRGAVDQLIPLNPDRIKIEQLETGRLVYEFTPVNGPKRRLNQDDVFHIRGLSSDGIMGISPISLMRESIGLALATEKYGAGLFTSDGAIRGILKHPGQLGPEGRKNLKKSFSKDAAGGTALLEEGLSWEKIGMTAEDAQFLMTRKFQINEFARWFNLPPHLLRDLDKATFSNIEQQAIDYVLYSMMPHFRRWEQAITRDLILAPQTFFAEFLIEGLLRGDTKSRYEAYASGISNGWMTRNEARIKENLNPLPGLDVPLAQMNMNPVQSRAELQDHLSSIFIGVAGNIVRREVKSISKAIERHIHNIDALKRWAEDFFPAHADYVAKGLAIDQASAEDYVKRRLKQFLSPLDEGSVVDVNQWGKDSIQELMKLNGTN